MILRATHTHLYPGHHGAISGVRRVADPSTERDCLVEFSDGSAANAKIFESAEGWRLQVDAYRTAAGTEIPAKQWILRIDQDDDQMKFRILAKATTD